jgi:predicted RNase H-like HicB family nuclease
MVAMNRKKNFVAVYEHDADDNVWLVHIKGVEGCQTYGRTIRQAGSRIREALAAWLDREPDTLVITPEMPRDIAVLASAVSQARMEAEQAGTTAQESTVSAVRQLTDMGLSRRDAADLLGISHQRVQQLLAS